MDCIHWAAIQRRNLPNLGGVENPKTSTGELDDDEIKEIFQFNLNEDLVADPPTSPLTQTSYDSCGMDSEKETGSSPWAIPKRQLRITSADGCRPKKRPRKREVAEVAEVLQLFLISHTTFIGGMISSLLSSPFENEIRGLLESLAIARSRIA